MKTQRSERSCHLETSLPLYSWKGKANCYTRRLFSIHGGSKETFWYHMKMPIMVFQNLFLRRDNASALTIYTAFVKIYHGRLEHPCSGSDNPGYIYSLSGTKVIRLVSPWIFWICPWQGDWDFASAFREGHKRCRWKKRHLCRKKMQTIFL